MSYQIAPLGSSVKIESDIQDIITFLQRYSSRMRASLDRLMENNTDVVSDFTGSTAANRVLPEVRTSSVSKIGPAAAGLLQSSGRYRTLVYRI